MMRNRANPENCRELNRKYLATDKGKAARARATKRYREKHAEKLRAHNAVTYALKTGRLQKEPCHCCGELRVEAHHPDYSAPLSVVWLCVAHHKQLHEEHEFFCAASKHFVDSQTFAKDNSYMNTETDTSCDPQAIAPGANFDALAITRAGRQLQTACHGASEAAGWWQDAKTGVDYLAEVRGNTRFGKALVAEKLALVHSEASEALEGHRKGLQDEKLPHRLAIEVELADAVIRIADLAGALELDLGAAIAEKMSFNAVRPDHKKDARLAAGGKAY